MYQRNRLVGTAGSERLSLRLHYGSTTALSVLQRKRSCWRSFRRSNATAPLRRTWSASKRISCSSSVWPICFGLDRRSRTLARSSGTRSGGSTAKAACSRSVPQRRSATLQQTTPTQAVATVPPTTVAHPLTGGRTALLPTDSPQWSKARARGYALPLRSQYRLRRPPHLERHSRQY